MSGYLSLAGMRAYVTSKLGQSDAASQTLVDTFIRTRYRMIADSFPWQDLQITAVIGLTGPDNVIPMPTGMERVIAIRSNGDTFLDPVNVNLLMQTDPTIFERTGLPTCYYEQCDQATSANQIIVLPMPPSTLDLFIVGKRTLPDLVDDSDFPIIRNIDNVLIAYAMGDLLERQRQYDKAKLKFDEAGAMLQAAQALETNQTNKPRLTKQTTVSGDSLAELVDAVCARTGMWDLPSVLLVKELLRRWHRMVCDSFDWQDLQLTAEMGLTGPNNVIPMPPGMDRVIAIRSNGDTFLDPVNVNLLMQTDPTIFERTGLPTCYYENVDQATRANQIIVLPMPPGTLSLFIVGKGTVPDLIDPSNTPAVRNIGNVLIAYAEGGMLERQSQYDKAKLKFEEAGGLLQAAQNLETTQGNKPRLTKQITVAGNSLAELVDAVCARTGMWDLPSINLVKEFLRRQYQRVWDACNWSEATVIARVNSDGSEIILPTYFNRIIALRGDVNLGQLPVVEPGLWFGVSPQIFEQSGTAIPASSWGYLTSVGVAALPPTREKLAFVSSSTDDQKKKVFVMGEVRGEHVSETVLLNGPYPVLTQNEYDTPLTVAKELTTGTVRVNGNTTGALLVRLLADERERKHMRIWLQPTPVATVCLVLGKRTMKPLVNNEDTPMLRDIQGVLIAAACGDMFAKAGNNKAATSARDEANTALKTMVDLETQQGAYSACVVPEVEYAGGYGDDAFYSKGYW